MPEKNQRERAQLAKKRGTTLTRKDTDAGEGPISRHAAKKSSHVRAFVQVGDRSVSKKAPPGTGRRLAPAEAPNVSAYKRRGSGTDPQPRPVSKVNGRKKAPSRMNIKSKGGPRKRMPIHGG